VTAPSPEEDPDDSDASPSPAESEPDPAATVDRLSDDEGTADNDGEVEHIASLVFARIENKLEQHLHTQMEMPSADQAAELREKAPEVYQAWIDIARQKADTESYIQRAQYEVPERLARTGRPWALGALVVVLIFCGYVASLGGSGIYVGGIIAALDLAALLGLFFGFRPGAALGSRRSKRELPPPGSDDDRSTNNQL
jgi:hypothetical protein